MATEPDPHQPKEVFYEGVDLLDHLKEELPTVDDETLVALAVILDHIESLRTESIRRETGLPDDLG